MTSTLSTFVPVLDGTNYQQWSAQMKSYLMAQGQWAVIKSSRPTPSTVTTRGDGETVEDITVTDMKDVLEFNEKNSKALGNIRLRLHHTIAYQWNDEESAATLWNALSEKYGKPGLPKAFLEFKGAMETHIPNNTNPSQALDKLLTHFIRLKEIGFELPNNVQVMMLLTKAPPSMEVVTQAMCQKSEILDQETASPSMVIQAMCQSWETHSRAGGKNQQQAHKLSAVKQANGPPQFQQQQNQQRGNEGQRGQGKKRTRRGKRGGADKQAAPTETPVQELLKQLAQLQQPSAATSPSSSSLQFAPSSFQLDPRPADFGHLASPTALPLPPSQSVYPSFNRTLNLVRSLGVKPSIKTMKCLETAELGKDQKRPNKRPRVQLPRREETPVPELPRGQVQGLEARIGGSGKGKERARDDDEVSLYDEDKVMGEDQPMTVGDFNPDDEYLDDNGLFLENGDNDMDFSEYWQVLHSHWGRRGIYPVGIV